MRKLIAILLLLPMGACKPTAGSETKNLEIAKAMFDSFNRHDWEVMANYYSEPALFLDPSFGVDYVSKTRQETAAKYREMQELFPDIHDEVVGLYPSGNKVIAEFISTGKAADSTSFRLPIISVLTIENGLIVKDATYYDGPDQQQQ